MLSNEKAMYQAYLVIECLPEEEKNLIPLEEIENLKKQMKIDENIKINPNISLSKQKIDDKTLDILDSILKRIDKNETKIKVELNEIKESQDVIDIKRISKLLTENYILNEKIKNIEGSNQKVEEYRDIAVKFKDVLEILNDEKDMLMVQLEKLNKTYNELPSLVKKIFLNNKKVKMIASGNK